MHKRILRLLAVVVAALMSLGAALVFIPSASALESTLVDISAELELPNAGAHHGPKTYAATGALVGDGPELTVMNNTGNPSDWDGDIAVDVDSNARTITVTADGEPWDFETIKVTLSTIAESSFEFAALELVSDDLLAGGTPNLLRFEVVDGEAAISWDVVRDQDEPKALDMSGSAVFKYSTQPKVTEAETTVAWDVYVACAAEEDAAPFTMKLFMGHQLVQEFEGVTPFFTGGSSIAGAFRVVIDARPDYKVFERSVRVPEGVQSHFFFPILPGGGVLLLLNRTLRSRKH